MEQTHNAQTASHPASQQSDATPVENLRDKVIAVLKTIYDPEIPVDIYELGLIYEITVYPVNNVFILMTLTSPACPSAEQIPNEVKEKVSAIPGINEVTVELTFNPPYSQEMMSEVAKLELGFL
ncbi:MAG: DUF59 domain-containing protein [Cytophagales bacterium]|nr:DUF59 domain-containing protein [Bernardetiaceae bacterium]MDW8204093.1 DUF59 domain-containing protein [Cytophagales bacterium]